MWTEITFARQLVVFAAKMKFRRNPSSSFGDYMRGPRRSPHICVHFVQMTSTMYFGQRGIRCLDNFRFIPEIRNPTVLTDLHNWCPFYQELLPYKYQYRCIVSNLTSFEPFLVRGAITTSPLYVHFVPFLQITPNKDNAFLCWISTNSQRRRWLCVCNL